MALELILNTVIPVFIIIGIGSLIGLFRKIETDGFVNLLVYIAAPCLLFSTVSKSSMSLGSFFHIMLVAACIIIITGFLAFLFLRKSPRKGLYLAMVFGNTAYLGYPVSLFAFGAEGLALAVVFDAVVSLFLFSVGIYIVHRKNEIKESFRVPLIYAVILGLIVNFLGFNIPELIFKPIEMAGMITIPLALLVLGYRLTEIKISNAKTVVLASLFKIVGGLLVALLVVKLFSIEGLPKSIILLQASMPSAVMTMVLCQKYKQDSALVASVVLVTTLLSVVTIPLILWIF